MFWLKQSKACTTPTTNIAFCLHFWLDHDYESQDFEPHLNAFPSHHWAVAKESSRKEM